MHPWQVSSNDRVVKELADLSLRWILYYCTVFVNGGGAGPDFLAAAVEAARRSGRRLDVKATSGERDDCRDEKRHGCGNPEVEAQAVAGDGAFGAGFVDPSFFDLQGGEHEGEGGSREAGGTAGLPGQKQDAGEEQEWIGKPRDVVAPAKQQAGETYQKATAVLGLQRVGEEGDQEQDTCDSQADERRAGGGSLRRYRGRGHVWVLVHGVFVVV